MTQQHFSLADTARMLKKSERTIHRLLKKGVIFYYDEKKHIIDGHSVIAYAHSKSIEIEVKEAPEPVEKDTDLIKENATLKERVAGLTDRLFDARKENEYLRSQNNVLLTLSQAKQETTPADHDTTKQENNDRKMTDNNMRNIVITSVLGLLSIAVVVLLLLSIRQSL